MLTERDGAPEALRSLLAERIIQDVDKMAPAGLRLASPRRLAPITGGTLRLEQHHFPEICFCLAGWAELHAGGRVVDLRTHEALIIAPEVPHSISSLHSVTVPSEKAFSRLVWITVFAYGSLVGICESSGGSHHSTRRRVFIGRHVGQLVHSAIEELEADQDNCFLMARSYLLQAVTLISRSRILPSSSAPEGDWEEIGPPQIEETIVGRARKYVYEHFDARIDLDAIARAACTNKSRLCREFRREAGRSVIDYLTHVRIEASKRLLLTDLKVASVAELVGFEDPYYFSRVFRRTIGLSPTEYRTTQARELCSTTG